MTDKLAKRPDVSVRTRGIMPQNMDELARLCDAIARSPSTQWSNPMDVLVSVQTGMELGMTPMQALSNVPVVKGRPFVMGAAALGVCRRDRAFAEGTDLELRYEGEGASRACFVRSHKRGQEQPTEWTRFGMDDAERANLVRPQSGWVTYPDRMLRWRAIGWHLRDHYSEVVLGLYLYEEAEDVGSAPRSGFGLVEAPRVVPDEARDPLLPEATVDVGVALEGLRTEILRRTEGDVEAARDLTREVLGGRQLAELTSVDEVAAALDALRSHAVFGDTPGDKETP